MIDEVTQRVAAKMAQQKEDSIKSALDRLAPGWSLVDIARRCTFVRYTGDVNEYLLLDGKAIMEFFPLETEMVNDGEKYIMRVSQACRNIA